MAIFSSYTLLTPPRRDYFDTPQDTVIDRTYNSPLDAQLDYIINRSLTDEPVLNTVNVFPEQTVKQDTTVDTSTETEAVSTPTKTSKPSNGKKTSLNYSSNKEFVLQMYPYVKSELAKIGKTQYTTTVLAQMCHECGWGKSISGINNYAGLKAKKSEKGTLCRTAEYDKNGNKYYTNDRFKDFDTVEEFVEEYIRRLKTQFHAFDGGDFVRNIKANKYFTGNEGKYRNSILSIEKKIKSYLQ